jgi:hypothetical protein
MRSKVADCGFVSPILVMIIGLCFSLATAQDTKTKKTAPKLHVKSCGEIANPPDLEGMRKLRMMDRLTEVVDKSGFNTKEFDNLVSRNDLLDEAANAYGFAYISWDKPVQNEMHEMVDKAIQKTLAGKKFSAVEQSRFNAFLPKFKQMMVTAFDLGRYDANRRPCPFQAVSKGASMLTK